jgi:CubicO group peptidase (beta-lactamase class C family)
MGIYGQLIHVDPAEELVIATHSAWDNATGDDYYVHQSAFIEAVTAALK